jgi:superfamily II DNA or RNA helicase
MAYHSKKTKKQKDLAIESFKNGNINVLCSTKALNQGFNVPNANMGIICGITSKSLSMIQRVGRLVRFKEGKIGNIIILYVADSQEEKWLKNATKNLNNVIWK